MNAALWTTALLLTLCLLGLASILPPEGETMGTPDAINREDAR